MKAHEILNAPGKWSKRSLAKDSLGRAVRYDSPEACSFCIMGALKRAYKQAPFEDYLVARANLAKAISPHSKQGRYDVITQWNDASHRTFSQVRNLLLKLDI